MGGTLANAARRILVGAAFLAICSVVGLTVPGPRLSAGENDGWTLTEADGRVLVQPAGEAAWNEAVEGAVLPIGSSVRTGESGAAILAMGGDEIRVMSSSEVELAEPDPAAGILTRIAQKVGTLLYKIAHRPSGTFRVDTPYLVVVVKGTEFGVSVSGEGTSVSVSQGVVSVARAEGGEASSVSAGQKASTSAEPGAAVSVTSENSSNVSPAETTTAEAAIDAEAGVEREARDEVVAGIDADLVGAYESARVKANGVGAARLVGATCQGCHLTVPSTEVERIRSGADDEIAYCDNCGTILVP